MNQRDLGSAAQEGSPHAFARRLHFNLFVGALYLINNTGHNINPRNQSR